LPRPEIAAPARAWIGGSAGPGVTSDKIRYVNFRIGRPVALIPALGLLFLARLACAAPPSVVFFLLDTVRADRLGAWGGPNPTSPQLDALAASGIRFARHFANSHATRPSMPQLMSGRYYHQNILRAFRPDDHPREFPFSRPDPTAILLPRFLRDSGFQLLAVSAHPWVARESAFGEPFQTFDLLPADASHAHAGAAEVIDRALRAWQTRDQSRPAFLYVHLMDAHMPRFLPGGTLRFPVPGYDAHRFRPDGEPAFGRERRGWSRFDASDFTAEDRRYFAAVYDTLLAFMDQHIGRLLTAVQAEDPGLAHTLVVVVADHGEELGDDGRIDHGDSLADGIQHIPWIMAGAGIAPGQVVERMTENVDVVPTVLDRLGLALPAGTHVDGRAQLAPDGTACAGCAKAAAYYAWEDYQGIRRRRYLLRRNLPGSLRARCDGSELAFAVPDDGQRTPLPVTAAPVAGLRRGLARRLAPLERTFLATRYGPADRRVVVRSDFWRLDGDPALACVAVGEDTPASAFRDPGWLATSESLTLLAHDASGPVEATVDLPDGSYGVELATIPVPRMPWLFGFSRWRRDAFEKDQPTAFVSLGTASAAGGRLRVVVPPESALHARVVGLRVSPAGVTAAPEPAAPDEDQLRRLRALGYVH
jgi:arylsulfatase A-like enzyme